MAVLVHEELGKLTPVQIQPENPRPPPPKPEPPEPPPAPEAPPPPKVKPHPVRSRATKMRRPTRRKAPPAQASKVVAQNPDPVDFTSETLVTGSATSYVGGATTSTGTSETAVPSDLADPQVTDVPDQSQPVRLRGRRWRCPWPQAALLQDIYEQFVVLKVVVAADGKVESVRILKDPGFGFGAAAVRCTHRTKFAPARNAVGKAIRSASSPDPSEVYALMRAKLKCCAVVLLVAAVVGSCAERQATPEECRAILDRIVEIELAEMGFRDSVLADRTKKRLARKYATDLSACIGRELSRGAMECVQDAPTNEQLSHDCLR